MEPANGAAAERRKGRGKVPDSHPAARTHESGLASMPGIPGTLQTAPHISFQHLFKAGPSFSSPCSSPRSDPGTCARKAKEPERCTRHLAALARHGERQAWLPGSQDVSSSRSFCVSPTTHQAPWASVPQTPGPDDSGCIRPSSGLLEKDLQEQGPWVWIRGALVPRGAQGAWKARLADRTLRGRGAVTQACQSLLTWSPVGIHPIVWRLLISKGRRPFSRTSANPCPRLDLGFPRKEKASVGRWGPSRGVGSVYTQQCWAPAPTGSCVCVHRWQRGPALPAQCPPGPPCSLPPSLLLSLAPFPSPLLLSSSFLSSLLFF